MRLKLGLLALSVVLVSIGVLPVTHWSVKKEKDMVSFSRVLVIDGVKYTVTLTRQGNELTGTLPPQVQSRYQIKTFRCGQEWQQLLVSVNTFQYRDREGKLWTADELSASSVPLGIGESGAWYYTDFTQRPPVEFTAIATVADGLIVDGWPPVYS